MNIDFSGTKMIIYRPNTDDDAFLAKCMDFEIDEGKIVIDLRKTAKRALLLYLTHIAPASFAVDNPYRRNIFGQLKVIYQQIQNYFDEVYLPKLNQYPKPLYAHQKEALATMIFRKHNMLSFEQGLGKAQPLYCKVLTPKGWVKMGEVIKGMKVISSSGKPCSVTGVYPQGKINVYKVSFSDGTSTECNSEHLWLVGNGSRRYIGKGWETKTTEEIRNDLTTSRGVPKWDIPVVSPVEFDIPIFNNDRTIDPYLLGLLLGDGCMVSNLSFSTNDNELIPVIQNLLPGDLIIKKQKGNNFSWNITNEKYGTGVNPLINMLKEMDLFNKRSHDKFIPTQYLFAPAADRLSLLQGLLDTDGHISSTKSRISISTVSPFMADNIEFLVRSLGGTTTRLIDSREGRRDCYVLHVVFHNDIIPFRLKRRLERFHQKKRIKRKQIVSIELIGKTEQQCISVDSPDHTYVTDDFIVTHNTVTSASMSRIFNIPRTIVICPTLVKWNWYRDLVDDWKYNGLYFTILDAKKSKNMIAFRERFVVCNYEMIHKHFNHLVKDQTLHIILDECHKIKRPSTDVWKNANKLIKAHPEAKVTLLSGTPVTNRVDDLFGYLKLIGHPLGGNHSSFIKTYTMYKATRGATKVTGAKNVDELKLRTSNLVIRRKTDECLDLPDLIIRNYHMTMEEYQDEYDKALEELYLTRGEARMGNLKANLHTLNRITAMAKVKQISALVESLREQGRKSIVFSSYTKPLDMLMEMYGDKCVKVDGSVDAHKRDQLITKFKKDDNCYLFLGNNKAAGVGINLVNANDVIFTNFPFTPDDLEQPYKRAHRIGQKQVVNVYYTICENSIDDNIYQLIVDKSRDINYLIDDNRAGTVHYDQIPTKLFSALIKDYAKRKMLPEPEEPELISLK